MRFEMNKIFSFVMALVATMMFSMTAYAASDYDLSFSKEDIRGLYIAPKVGIAYVELDDIHMDNSDRYSHDHRTAFATGLSVGYDFSKRFDIPVRAELDYTFINNTKFYVGEDFHRVDTHSLLVNIAYDFKEVPVVTPYIVGGIGTAWNSTSDAHFAFAVGGGLYYNVTENVAVDFSVRYVDNGSVHKFGQKADLHGANTMLAVRYTF